MSRKKKSFLLHIDSLEILDSLSDEQVAKLFRAIKAYHSGEDFELDEITKLVFFPFKQQFARDSENYQDTCNRNKINGLKGGRPKKPKEPTETEKTHSVIEEPKKADNDSDNEKDSDSDSKKDKPNRSACPPKKESLDYERIKDLFNKSLTNASKVVKLTDKRKKLVKKLFDDFELDYVKFENYLTFLNGHPDTQWMFERQPKNNGTGQFWNAQNFEYFVSEKCFLNAKENLQ